MNRRDTVIVAAVLNCVLLGALFMTAKRSEDKHSEIPATAFKAPIIENISNPRGGGAGDKTSGELVRQFMEEAITIAPAKEATPEPAVATVSPSKTQENKNVVAETTPVVTEAKEAVRSTHPEVVKKESAPASEKMGSFVTVVVKKGDFLERIAKANGTTVHAIMKLNNLTSTQLKIGQILKVPESKEEKKTTAVAVASSDDYYTVHEGDSAWSVALRHNMKVVDLMRLNDLDEQSARKIKPGDQLRVR